MPNETLSNMYFKNNSLAQIQILHGGLNMSGFINISSTTLSSLDFNITNGTIYDSGITNISTGFGNYIIDNARNVTIKSMNLTNSGASTTGCANTTSFSSCTLITNNSNVINITNVTGIGSVNLTMYFDAVLTSAANSNMINISRYVSGSGWRSVGQSFANTTIGVISLSQITSFSTFGVVKFTAATAAVATTMTSASNRASPQTINPTVVSTVLNVRPGAQLIFTFSEEKSSIIDIILSLNKYLKSANIIVINLFKEKLSKPLDILVYKYYEIRSELFSEADLIGDVTVKFTVEKSWLTSNNLDKNNMVLYRFTDKWDVLPTTLLSEDENKVHYSSLTSGFSYFAIGEKQSVSAPKPAEQVTSEQITSTVEKKEISVTKGETRNLLIIGIILISIILIISTIFLFRYIRSIRLKRT